VAAAPTTLDVGQTFDITGTLRNNGPSAAATTQLALTIPAGLTITTSTCANPCDLGLIGSGGEQAFSYTLRADVAGGYTVDLNATTTTPDPGPGPNSASVSVTANPAVDIEINFTVDNPAPANGDPIVYTLTATNAGPSDATGVTVTNSAPAGVTYDTTTPDAGTTYDGTTWDIGALTAGATVTLTIDATVTAVSGETVDNIATLASVDQTETDNTDDSATASITVP
jgi:uncharacterized repeat protein (TIGR01451 family)